MRRGYTYTPGVITYCAGSPSIRGIVRQAHSKSVAGVDFYKGKGKASNPRVNPKYKAASKSRAGGGEGNTEVEMTGGVARNLVRTNSVDNPVGAGAASATAVAGMKLAL